MEIVSSGIVTVPSGVSATELYIIQEGVLAVLDGGWAQDIGLAEGGQGIVSSGGTASIIMVSSGGSLLVSSGGTANDVAVNGIGNDRMHGGGGDDIFTFCENWGTDTVEQLADGSVLLWFASGGMKNWDAETLTYTDGDNSVKVSGVTADKITLKFGNDWSALFSEVDLAGGFLDFSSRRIFEESDGGFLA